MTQKEVLEKFVEISHVSKDEIDIWFPNGRSSVRVRLKNGNELIFTYKNKNIWRLETKASFLEDF